MKKSASRAALLYCWTLRYVVKRRIFFFSLRFDGLGYRVRVGLASGDKDLCTIFLHTPTCTYLSVRGGTCIHTTVNPTSLCCALLYPLSRPPAYCMVRREAWRLYLRTGFFLLFPLSRTDRGGRGKRRFFVPCRYQKKKESDRHGATSPTTFYFFPSLHTRPCSQHVVDWRHVFVKEGKKERGRGVSDGPWRTFRLLRSGIDVPVQAVL